MHPELEELIRLFDAAIEATPERAARAIGDYQQRLAESIERRPGLSIEALHRMVKKAHGHWLRAHRKDPTIPPSA